MRRVRAALVVVVVGPLSACAGLLGIDDGTPRDDDAAVPDAADAAPLPDTSPPPDTLVPDTSPYSPLSCGDASCNAAGGEQCCKTGVSVDASDNTYVCVSDASACPGGLLITCDRAANCAALGHPGDICCANVPTSGGAATSVDCVAPGTCTGAIVCEPGDDELCVPDSGLSCKPSALTLVGYLICK